MDYSAWPSINISFPKNKNNGIRRGLRVTRRRVLPDVSTNNSSCRDCNTDSRNRTRSHSRPSKGGGLIPALAQELENGQAPLIAANDFPVDQAGPHLQIVHGLDHEGEAGGPIIAPFGEQTDADRIAPGHQTITVMLDLVDPIGAGRWLSGLAAPSDDGHPRTSGPCQLIEVPSPIRRRGPARKNQLTRRRPHHT